MIYFQCKLCRTKLSAQDGQSGQPMRCPNCMAAVEVPAAERQAVAVGPQASGESSDDIPIAPPKPKPRSSPPPIPAPTASKRPPTQYGKRYGFNCVYCSSRLEATETMAGHEGQCPTCGNGIVIPILNRNGQLIDPITREIIKQDPHPVHAYAAAGERAPGIVRTDDGTQQIVCAKCRRPSPISANNCRHCGMPFTMEGTVPEAAGANGAATAALALGVIGVPFGCTVIVPLLAIVFGVLALTRGGEAKAGRGSAIAGIVCGVAGLGVAVLFYNR